MKTLEDERYVLVIAWQQGLYARYWHCCDVKPEGRRPEGFTSAVPISGMQPALPCYN